MPQPIPIPQDATIRDASQDAQTQPESQQSTAVPIPADATLLNEGEQINDVGNKVIVPKEGENFEDTMQRAAAQGKQTTQAQLNAEEQTMPTKVAQTLVAAPAIGAAVPAAEAGIASIPGASEAVLKHLESQAAGYLAKYPTLIGIAKALGVPTTAAGLLLYLHHNSK
jgi:hypothetical protein